MANGEEKLLVIGERQLELKVKAAVQDVLLELDLATVNQCRKKLERTREDLARARADAETQREVARLRAEKIALLEKTNEALTAEKYDLVAQLALKQSMIENLEAGQGE